MKPTTLLALAASVLLSSSPPPADAIHLRKRQAGQPPRVVSMPTERRPGGPSPLVRDRTRSRRRRRTAAQAAALDNRETLYYINATVGTPPQPVRLHLDTGSSDLWVNTPASRACRLPSDPCAFAGTYVANDSSTYEYVGSYFNISYVDGSGAAGDYVSDAVTIGGGGGSGAGGGVSLERLQFGIGYESSSAQGILGIGYPVNEVQVGRAGKAPYDNLPAQMVADGIIASSAYSLWLNDLDANTGSILFGGVDSSRYEGELQTLPIQKQAGVYSEFLITLTGLTVGSPAAAATPTVIASDIALAVLLDSGSSLTYLPDAMAQAVYAAVGASWDEDQGAAYVPCSLASSASLDLTFTFTSPAIAVSMGELVLPIADSLGDPPTFADGVTTACLFGIAPAGRSGGASVLGDTFLRSAYVVYDLGNNEVSLAPTRFNVSSGGGGAAATDDDDDGVREIGTGSGAVPDAVAVSDAAVATAGLVVAGAAGSGGTGRSKSGAEGWRGARGREGWVLGGVLALAAAGFVGLV